MNQIELSLLLTAMLLGVGCSNSSDGSRSAITSGAGGTTAAGTPGSGAGAGNASGGVAGTSAGGTAAGSSAGGMSASGSGNTAGNGPGGSGGTAGNAPACSVTPLQGAPSLGIEEVASGFTEPLGLETLPGDSRLFVVERPGQVKIVKDGVLNEAAFLDIRELVEAEGLDADHEERGLLGFAFAPDYALSGRLYVAYNRDGAGDWANTRIAEFTVSADPDLADAASEKLVLEIPKPSLYHNGGQLRFGPDGYLYFGTGDGRQDGGEGDGDHDGAGNGQNPEVLLGKMLRIAPKAGGGYDSPADNPFVGQDGRDEIWARGLRNPFRFSFDRETGDLWIGDVGRRGGEEINFQSANSSGGENYGWSLCEGDTQFKSPGCGGLTAPLLIYAEGGSYGRSVMGGFVYRGCSMPALHGSYFFADFYGTLYSGPANTSGAYDDITDDVLGGSSFGLRISGFGEDNEGELYLLDWDNGKIFKLVHQ